MAAFVLNVQEIEDSGKRFAFPLTSSWLDGALVDAGLHGDPGADAGVLEVHASRSGADVVVTGNIAAHVVAECSRCLGAARLEIGLPFASLFTARGPALRDAPDEQELTPEELQREFFTGDRIVLDDFVRDQIIVEVPMQPLCAATCPGIELPASVRAPEELAGPAVDPRLSPLRALADKVRTQAAESSTPEPQNPTGTVRFHNEAAHTEGSSGKKE